MSKPHTVQPLITIVTPSYNQGRFIRATVESVLGQDYPHFELLIFDACSTDETAQVLRSLEGDPRMRWVSEPDQGQADAINKGLAQARGEIFIWLNSDDLFLPGALGRVARAWQEHGPAIYYGLARLIDADGADLGPCPNQSPSLDARKLLTMRALPMQPATFVPTAAVRECGGLDTRYHFGLDYDLWVRLAAVLPIRHVPHELALYRLHDSSKTVAQSEAFCGEADRILCSAASRGQLSLRQARAAARLFAARVYLQPTTLDLNRALTYLREAVLAAPGMTPHALVALGKAAVRQLVGERVWAQARSLRTRIV